VVEWSLVIGIWYLVIGCWILDESNVECGVRNAECSFHLLLNPHCACRLEIIAAFGTFRNPHSTFRIPIEGGELNDSREYKHD